LTLNVENQEIRLMDNGTYHSREAEMRTQQEKQVSQMYTLIALGAAVGAALLFLLAPQFRPKKRHTFKDTLENSLDDGRQTLKRLEKDFYKLRRTVEERLGEL
jgi:hypothetical protein